MGWIKFHRRREALDLLLRHPFALALLTLLAVRARYSAGRDPRTGIELQVGEALTGRGDAETIGASPKQYRVARDQLIKWGFVAMVRATSRAMWGTALKITDTAIYEIVPLVEGQAEGQAEGQGGAKEGPRRGHEHRTIEQIEHLPPIPPQGEMAEAENVFFDEKSKKIARLTDKAVVDTIKKGRQIKNLPAYRQAVRASLERQSPDELQKTLEYQVDDGSALARQEAERTRKYIESLGN